LENELDNVEALFLRRIRVLSAGSETTMIATANSAMDQMNTAFQLLPICMVMKRARLTAMVARPSAKVNRSPYIWLRLRWRWRKRGNGRTKTGVEKLMIT
jgi:hypothetical protein